MLIIVCGLPGSGKTTLSRALAKKFGKRFDAVRLSSDEIRKTLYPVPKYTDAEKRSVYSEMAKQAEAALRAGRMVIADGTFYKKQYLDRMIRSAGSPATRPIIIYCDVALAAAKSRIAARSKKGKDLSDADFKIHEMVRREFEPIEQEHLIYDGSKLGPRSRAAIIKLIETSCKYENYPKMISSLLSSLPGAGLEETHISWLILHDDFVYKIKKPVKLSFLDFSNLENRKAACDEEVRLNRRLAPSVYLGVVPIVEETGGRVLIGRRLGAGRLLDFAVKMKRLDHRNKMDVLVASGRVSKKDIETFGRMVADFHSKADVCHDSGHHGSPGFVWKNISDLWNYRAGLKMACGPRSSVQAWFVLSRCKRFIAKNRAMLSARAKGGFVRDGHGDLHCSNVFLGIRGVPHGIVIFDCIEFSADFRHVDILNDIAFMAMDLDSFGRTDLSKAFIQAYQKRFQNPRAKTRNMAVSLPEPLLNLYKCYRATVRAKVAAIDLMEGVDAGRGDAKERVKKYLLLAEKYAKGL